MQICVQSQEAETHIKKMSTIGGGEGEANHLTFYCDASGTFVWLVTVVSLENQ